MRQHLRTNVIGYVALFVALSGTVYAVDGPLNGQNKVGSADIIDGEVLNPDLGANSVGSGKVIDGNLVGADIKNDSITGVDVSGVGGADVTNGSLTGQDVADNQLNADDVFGLGTADINDNSLTSADVLNQSLTGIDISDGSLGSEDVRQEGLRGEDIDEKTLRGFGCANGLVKGYARIIGASSVPTTPTSSNQWVEAPYNCSGGSVTVRRTGGGGPGTYEVMFNGVAPRVAQASPVTSWGGSSNSNANNIVATNLGNPGEGVDVIVTDAIGDHEEHGWFTIVVM